jgi:hypothetical protein
MCGDGQADHCHADQQRQEGVGNGQGRMRDCGGTVKAMSSPVTRIINGEIGHRTRPVSILPPGLACILASSPVGLVNCEFSFFI